MFKRLWSLFLFGILCGVASAQTPGPSLLRAPETGKVELGVDAARKGQVEEAARLFREAVDADPGIAPPGLSAAAAWARQTGDPSRFDKVRFWIEKTAVDYPNDPEAFLLLAEMAVTDGRLVEANLLLEHAGPLVDALKSVPPVTPEEREARPADDAATPARADSADRKRTLQGRVRMIAVSIAEGRKDWAEAAKLLEAVIAEWPEHSELLLRLGRIRFKGGHREEGIEALREGVEKNPGWSLLSLIVDLYEQEGFVEEAKGYLARALEAEPTNPKVLAQAAELEIKWNDLAAAEKAIGRLEEIAPSDLHMKRLRGVLALYDAEYAAAETSFEKVLERRPEDAVALSGLILALCEARDPKKLQRAQVLASDFFRRYPESADAVASLALVHLWKGQLASARQLLEEKFESGEMGALGAYYLASALDGLGERDEAVLFLRSALERPTNFPQRRAAEQLLKRLESR